MRLRFSAISSGGYLTPYDRRGRRHHGQQCRKLVFTILSEVVEAERDRIRERIAGVKRDQRQLGRYLRGRESFGWRVADGRLVARPRAAGSDQQMPWLHAKGLSLRAIAARQADENGINITRAGIAKILATQDSRR